MAEVMVMVEAREVVVRAEVRVGAAMVVCGGDVRWGMCGGWRVVETCGGWRAVGGVR
jgi:hypothetical protein